MRNIPAETQRQSSVMDTLVAEIRSLMDVARTNVVREVNTTMLYAYWQIGRIIVEGEQNGKLKAQYGAKLIPELSKRLTKELGRGYSRFNLQYMRLLYCEYPSICRTASCKLTWSHYIELLSVEDRDARAFYERECENARWSVKELNRQIGTSLFERHELKRAESPKGNSVRQRPTFERGLQDYGTTGLRHLTGRRLLVPSSSVRSPVVRSPVVPSSLKHK